MPLCTMSWELFDPWRLKPDTQRSTCVCSLWIKWKMSNFQMSELSGKVSTKQQHAIPTVSDRSSDICVYVQACLCHEEEKTPSLPISVTSLFHKHSESLLKMLLLIWLQRNMPAPRVTTVILISEVHVFQFTPVYWYSTEHRREIVCIQYANQHGSHTY